MGEQTTVEKIDINMYLEKDGLRTAGQNYAVISLVSPQSNQKYDKIAIKIKGCFNTYEEAKEQAKRYHKIDNTFDIHVVEMYSWVVVPPENDKLKEVHYDDEVLDNLITTHTQQQEMARVEFEKYKREMLEYGKKHAKEAAEKEAERERLDAQKRLEEIKDTRENEILDAQENQTTDVDGPSGSVLQQMIEATDEMNFSKEPLEPIKPFRQNAMIGTDV